jgi:hypothetical protein
VGSWGGLTIASLGAMEASFSRPSWPCVHGERNRLGVVQLSSVRLHGGNIIAASSDMTLLRSRVAKDEPECLACLWRGAGYARSTRGVR